MQLALVQGRATTTVRHRSLEGQKLLVCQQLDVAGDPSGDPILAVDQLGAGAGDVVIISSDGLGLRELLRDNNSPVRWWTLGIVDAGMNVMQDMN
ncbi:MAG: ethanolamine utilization protein EutN [Planctomycetaceae bacterium]|nr:ethanolamine utilization protein EutN [Planctomycetaceae bacterium]